MRSENDISISLDQTTDENPTDLRDLRSYPRCNHSYTRIVGIENDSTDFRQPLCVDLPSHMLADAIVVPVVIFTVPPPQ